MRSSSFPRKIFDIFVHLSSNHIGHVSPWIVDHPRNLRENGNGSEVPVWWLGRELDLFSAHCYLGIPGGALYAVGKVFRWGCIEAPLSQLVTGCVTCHTNHGCVTHFRPTLGNLVEVTLVYSFPC